MADRVGPNGDPAGVSALCYAFSADCGGIGADVQNAGSAALADARPCDLSRVLSGVGNGGELYRNCASVADDILGHSVSFARVRLFVCPPDVGRADHSTPLDRLGHRVLGGIDLPLAFWKADQLVCGLDDLSGGCHGALSGLDPQIIGDRRPSRSPILHWRAWNGCAVTRGDVCLGVPVTVPYSISSLRRSKSDLAKVVPAFLRCVEITDFSEGFEQASE